MFLRNMEFSGETRNRSTINSFGFPFNAAVHAPIVACRRDIIDQKDVFPQQFLDLPGMHLLHSADAPGPRPNVKVYFGSSSIQRRIINPILRQAVCDQSRLVITTLLHSFCAERNGNNHINRPALPVNKVKQPF